VEVFKTIDFFMPFFLLLLWYLFGMYSETANNHGRIVAFLLPFVALAFLILFALFAISRVLVYPFFVIFRKKEKYNDFVYRVKNLWLWSFKEFPDEVNKDQ